MLSFVFPSHFLHEDILNRLTSLLELDDESVAPHILAALTFLGKYRPLSECKHNALIPTDKVHKINSTNLVLVELKKIKLLNTEISST